MSYWLHGMLPKFSTRDRIIMRIKDILATSPSIVGVLGDPLHIVRRSAYVPFTAGLVSPPVLILAPMDASEEPRLSAVIKATLDVGIMLEYQDYGESIPDGEPSADTFLEEVQRLLDANPLLLLPGEDGADNPLSIDKHFWQTVQPGAKDTSTSSSPATLYYVGLVCRYVYRTSNPARQTGIAGQHP